MFKTVQALPLRERRTWCPRINRSEHAERPRNITDPEAWRRPGHGLDSTGNRTLTGTFRVQGQSLSAFNSRQQPCPRPIRVHAKSTTSIVREQATAADTNCSQTVRSHEPSTSLGRSWTQTIPDHGPAKNHPRRLRTVPILATIDVPFRIQTTRAYVLV